MKVNGNHSYAHLLCEMLALHSGAGHPRDVSLIRASNKFLVSCDALLHQELADFGFSLLERNIFRLPFNDCLIEVPDFYKITGQADEIGLVEFIFVTQSIGEGVAYSGTHKHDVNAIPRGQDDIQLWCELYSLRKGDNCQMRPFPGVFLMDMSSSEKTEFDCLLCDPKWAEHGRNLMEILRGLMFSFVALINSKSAETQRVEASRRLNKARKRRNKEPFYSFNVVTLPSGVEDRSERPSGFERASPRLHWRRGHYRRWKGSVIPVSPCLVGIQENGVIAKLYKAGAVEGDRVQ